MTEPEYDEATCVTARELRAAGYPVPDSVPDPGWIRRSSIRLTGAGPATFDPETQRISCPMGVAFDEPFRWIAVCVEQATD